MACLKIKPSQCLNRGIDFIDKRATFSIDIDFKPSVDSKELRLVYVSEIKYTVCYECTFFHPIRSYDRNRFLN